MAHIVLDSLTKRYGSVTAVDDLSLVLEPGSLTGFIGVNGAGKTTTLRMLLGLTRPTAGTATIDGRAYVDIPVPARVVGALVDPGVFHPGRTGRDALRVLARASDLPVARVDEVLELVDLQSDARRRVAGYSMGMQQRLALAAALLGDPETLVFDEPANGLDPVGVKWLRTFLRSMADEGRTVLVSSHQLAELAQTVDDVAIVHDGRLVARGSTEELLSHSGATSLEDLLLSLITTAEVLS
jgi:ABC-2 type transport system ATP-binding protein